MTNFLPTLISKLPSVMQEIAVDSLTSYYWCYSRTVNCRG